MKKIILGLAATALIFASCSEDKTSSVNDPRNPNAIGFETGTGKVIGRATVNNLTSLQGDVDGFGIFATNKVSPVEFIDNAAYYYSGGWKWKITDIEWPTTTTDYPVNFYAYYPVAETNLSTTLNAPYTVEDAVGSQIDYLAAQKTGVTIRPAYSKVVLDFKHIMSKVDFKVSAGAGMTVEVQSIEVKQVGNARQFNYGTMVWGAAPSTHTSNYKYMAAPVVSGNKFVNNTAVASEPAAVAPANGSMILMPQDLSDRAWAATAAPTSAVSYIEVVYRVIETATDDDIVGMTDAAQHPSYASFGGGVTGPLFVKVGYSLPTAWLMNKAYTYVLHLGDTGYTGGNLTDDTFIDKNGNSTNLPVVDPGTPSEEKEIPDTIYDAGNVIGFTVDVLEWETTTGIDL